MYDLIDGDIVTITNGCFNTFTAVVIGDYFYYYSSSLHKDNIANYRHEQILTIMICNYNRDRVIERAVLPISFYDSHDYIHYCIYGRRSMKFIIFILVTAIICPVIFGTIFGLLIAVANNNMYYLVAGTIIGLAVGLIIDTIYLMHYI